MASDHTDNEHAAKYWRNRTVLEFAKLLIWTVLETLSEVVRNR
jgi:uncharacterized membrane protein